MSNWRIANQTFGVGYKKEWRGEPQDTVEMLTIWKHCTEVYFVSTCSWTHFPNCVQLCILLFYVNEPWCRKREDLLAAIACPGLLRLSGSLAMEVLTSKWRLYLLMRTEQPCPRGTVWLRPLCSGQSSLGWPCENTPAFLKNSNCMNKTRFWLDSFAKSRLLYMFPYVFILPDLFH